MYFILLALCILQYMNKMYQLMHLSLLTLTNIPRHMFQRCKSPSSGCDGDLQRQNICRGILVNVNNGRCISWDILFIYSVIKNSKIVTEV
jgi:hypothetical protein